MDDIRRGLAAWLQQQAECRAPDLIFSAGFLGRLTGLSAAARPPAVAAPAQGPLRAAAASRPLVAVPAPATQAPVARRPRPIRGLQHIVVEASRPHGPDHEARREELKKVFFEARDCQRCGLAKSRTTVVFGSGNVEAPLLVVGEAPGAEEDAQGLPFVGAAGRLLTDMLAAIKLDRERDVFIANVLKCRPPENRNPENTEIAACLPFLRRQVEIVRPRALLLLGRTAASAVLERTEGVGELRTQSLTWQGTAVFVTYHPAALLRNQSYKRPAWEDLKRLAQFLKEQQVHGSLQQ